MLVRFSNLDVKRASMPDLGEKPIHCSHPNKLFSTMDTDAIVVMITTSSEDEAVAIAALLVRDHLAACVSLFPVSSVYTWDNRMHHDQEWQLMIKTQRDKFADLETKVRELHTYDVPEIIALPVTAGSMPYLNWISTQVQS